MPNVQEARTGEHDQEAVVDGDLDPDRLVVGGPGRHQLDEGLGAADDVGVEGVRQRQFVEVRVDRAAENALFGW